MWPSMGAGRRTPRGRLFTDRMEFTGDRCGDLAFEMEPGPNTRGPSVADMAGPSRAYGGESRDGREQAAMGGDRHTLSTAPRSPKPLLTDVSAVPTLPGGVGQATFRFDSHAPAFSLGPVTGSTGRPPPRRPRLMTSDQRHRAARPGPSRRPWAPDESGNPRSDRPARVNS